MIVTWPREYMTLVDLIDSFNFRTDKIDQLGGNRYRLTLRNQESRCYYSRRALSSDRRSPIVCYHGWRDFIRLTLVEGATRISTVYGRWTTIDQFDRSLPIIRERNIGSFVSPITLPDLCTHERQNPPAVVARAVEVVLKGAPSHAL